MINKNEIIPIFFTIDDAYAPYLHVALISLIENASKDRNYKIIVVYLMRRIEIILLNWLRIILILRWNLSI